jgi:formylglycine-generating enzyme required for sulfatase activity
MVYTVERGVTNPPYIPVLPEETENSSGFKNEILLLISAPLLDNEHEPIVSLSIQQEIDGIVDALQDLQIGIEIVVKVATADVFSELLCSALSPLVIHFIGHGMKQEDGVSLVLEDKVGMARPFSDKDFRLLLGNRRRPPCQMAFLNACHSEGLADELLRAGVGHVVAVNAEDAILDVAARCFARIFYAALFQGNTVQEAFERGRRNVLVNDEVREILDPRTFQPINILEALKFRLLPGNSDIHQQSIQLQSTQNGRVLAPRWENISPEIPSEDRSFIGRNLEIHQVAAALVSDGAKCVALHGMGGMGKTSLAKAVGRWQHERRRWRDGVWFVDLRAAQTINEVQARIIKVIGKNSDPNLNMLLILDNLDDLIDHDGVVGLIEGLLISRRSRILLTSRKVLPSRVLNQPQEVQGTEPTVAKQIFRRFAPTQQHQLYSDGSTLEDFAEVMELLDGYPLAIRIAATYLEQRRCGLRELRERLTAEFPGVMGSSLSKDDSLIASLNLSYNILPPDTQNMLANLALFPGGLTTIVAKQIFGRGGVDALETLMLYSMAEQTSSRVWRLPEPARQYAEDKQLPGAMDRYAPKTLKYYYDFSQGLVDSLTQDGVAEKNIASQLFEQQANLKHFLVWGYNHEQKGESICYGARITALLARFWDSIAPGEDPLVSINRALSAAERNGDRITIADLYKVKGDRLLVKQGLSVSQESYRQAIELYESIAPSLQSPLEKAEILQKLGEAWDCYPEPNQAEVNYRQAFELFGSVGEILKAAQMQMAIGDIQESAERLENALASYQAALALYQSRQDRSGIVRAENRIRIIQGLSINLETTAPFKVVTVDRRGEVTTRTNHVTHYFTEILPGRVSLDMIQVPAGEFFMGSPTYEVDRKSSESPRHLVTVPTFCMGKYPITQEQWRVVANLPAVNRELQSNPSGFKGDLRPVERVSWLDAQEFCARVSTGREYRLPSEAEWEYACRAGTITPFHFGETITTNLANYRGIYNSEHEWPGFYGRGPKGIYRKETTPAGTFSPNIFGLYDMHGNIWEWCLDHYHSDYEGAPIDGSAWINPDAEQDAARVLRGGSWGDNPQNCRSAYRSGNGNPDIQGSNIGFRVVCEAARTS